jgi:hypothetical protein
VAFAAEADLPCRRVEGFKVEGLNPQTLEMFKCSEFELYEVEDTASVCR